MFASRAPLQSIQPSDNEITTNELTKITGITTLDKYYKCVYLINSNVISENHLDWMEKERFEA